MRSASATTTQKYCPSCRDHFSGDALFCPNDGSPLATAPAREIEEMGPPAPPPDLYVGREISGHIEIGELAGIGAMGRVYRAFQKGIDRDVAVKILHRELSANPQLVARFHREAKVASRLQHPNVVHVHLAGQLPDGALYIVMEYLDGLSLQSALAATDGVMPLPRALHIALQLCDAVGEAHVQGVVHRDLKPENVMLVRRGEDADYVKVLDFGIARLSWGEQSMATAAGLIFGTARYISPEGAQGESVGPPGDVYAIATLLYQMLSGRTPFEGEQAVGILIQQIHDPPPPLKSMPLAASVPDALADIVMQNLAKDRNLRAPDARALGRTILDAMRVSGTPPRVSRTSLTSSPSFDVPVADPSIPPGAAPTRQWLPPPSFQERLAATPPPPESAPLPMRLDTTLDDVMTPVPPLAATVRLPRPGVALPPAPSFPPVEPRRTALSSQPQGGYVTPAPAGITPPPSRPSGVESTLPGEWSEPSVRDLPAAPRRLARLVAMVFLLFLVGSAAAAAMAYRFGLLPVVASGTTLEDTVARARDAMANGRWDAPPGDNVRDLTNEGLARWPGDLQLIEIRTHSSDELMKRAIAAKAAGDLQEAVRDAQLATVLDPSDYSKRALVHEYETDILHAAPVDSLPLLADAGASPSRLTGSPRALLETAPAKPRMGQQVDFAARISGDGKTVTEARFTVSGPGLAGGAKLAAMGESSVYRSGFTFLEAGRYEVTFLARVDGTPVRAVRIIVVEGPKSTPSPSPELPNTPAPSVTAPATPAPSGSVKWL